MARTVYIEREGRERITLVIRNFHGAMQSLRHFQGDSLPTLFGAMHKHAKPLCLDREVASGCNLD